MSFDRVPRRPSAAFSSLLWRLCEVTPRLTRGIWGQRFFRYGSMRATCSALVSLSTALPA